MSKFIDAVGAELHTGRKYNLMEPLSVTMDVADPIGDGMLLEYRVGVKWGRVVHCKPKDSMRILDNVVLELRHEVYGELWSTIIRLERAIYERDEQEMLSAIRDIKVETGMR
jgi:hypothetical protein